MLEKAALLPADEVVVDLEDGVAADAKDEARANLPGAGAQGTLAVRINGLASPWCADTM
jgi:citrate lyase subunit beta/citryl-CoA lyase